MHLPISLTALALLAGSVWAQMDPMVSADMDPNASTDNDPMAKSTSAVMMAGTTTKAITTTAVLIPVTMKSSSTSMMMLMPTTSKSSTTVMTTPIMSKPTMILGTSIASKPTIIIGTSVTTKVILPTGMTTSKPSAMMMATGMTTKATSTALMMTLGSKTIPPAAMATNKVVTHVVKVSTMNNTLSFVPNSLVAAPGSLVQFQFFPKNHSVVQAAFSNPCLPINSVQPAVRGLFSGFMPTTGAITPIFTILINDTLPIWYYCSQGTHCQQGMVGVINPPMAQTVQQFAAAAKVAPAMAPRINGTAPFMPSGTTRPGNFSATVPGIVRQTVNAAAGGAGAWRGAGIAGMLAALGFMAL